MKTYDRAKYGALFDAHVHSYFDFHDGMITPQDLVDAVYQRGLNWVCAMAHDTVRGVPKIRRLAKEKGLPTISGIEISTTHNHLLAYGLQEWHVQRDCIDPDEAIELLREQDAAIFLAHPYTNPKGVDHGYWSPRILEKLDVDGIEYYNGGTYFLNRGTKKNLSNFIPKGRRIAGTDAHHKSNVGYAYTQVDINSEDPDDLVAAMQNGKCKPYMNPVPLHRFLYQVILGTFKNKVLKRRVVEGTPIIANGDRPGTEIVDHFDPHSEWVSHILRQNVFERKWD